MSKVGDLTCVGAIAGSFGVRGEVRLKSFCAIPEDIADYNPVALEDGREITVRLTGQIKNGLSARLSGVGNKEAADALRGQRLYVPRDRLPHLPDDEYYHADLIGLAVHDTGGTHLGKLTAVHNHGAGDLLEVKGPTAKGGVLVPFTLQIVPTVDLRAARVVIDPPDGLF